MKIKEFLKHTKIYNNVNTFLFMPFQLFSLSKKHELRREHGCADISTSTPGDIIYLKSCHNMGGNQEVMYKEVIQYIPSCSIHAPKNLCLELYKFYICLYSAQCLLVLQESKRYLTHPDCTTTAQLSS